MAEIFGKAGDVIPVSGEYECAECGHRETLEKEAIFPPSHHPEKPWTLYLAAGKLPGQEGS